MYRFLKNFYLILEVVVGKKSEFLKRVLDTRPDNTFMLWTFKIDRIFTRKTKPSFENPNKNHGCKIFFDIFLFTKC